MSQALSSSAGQPFGLARVCRVWHVARSSVYAWRSRQEAPLRGSGKRGPQRGILGDKELVAAIRDVLAASPWVGEGHRKVWARLRADGVRTSRRRVLALMRAHGVLTPVRARRDRGPRTHDGTIVTARPDEIWGTDATSTTTGEGAASIFFVVDHCTWECLGIHAARRGTRWEALEPLRQAVRESFGGYRRNAGTGLTLRHDHGSQFVSDDYQGDLRFLGITSSPSFVRQPEGNGCAERWVRLLKEQLLWMRRFATVEELRSALHDFRKRYNTEWIVARHGYRSPGDARIMLQSLAAA